MLGGGFRGKQFVRTDLMSDLKLVSFRLQSDANPTAFSSDLCRPPKSADSVTQVFRHEADMLDQINVTGCRSERGLKDLLLGCLLEGPVCYLSSRSNTAEYSH